MVLVYAKPSGNDDNNASNEWTDYALSRVLSAVPRPSAQQLLRGQGHGCHLPSTCELRSERTGSHIDRYCDDGGDAQPRTG